jgi:uncharacterized protein
MTNQDDDDSCTIENLAALEFKFASADNAGEFSGYAAVFGNVDSHQDVIQPGAFADSIASHKAAGTMPPLLWAHDQTKPVGKTLSLSEDQRGLLMHGKLNLATTAGRDAYGHVKARDMSGISVGFKVPAGGALYARNARTLQRIAIHEVSLVTMPSNDRARIHEVKSKTHLSNIAECERQFREKLGLSIRAAQLLAAGGFPALQRKSASASEIDMLASAAELESLLRDAGLTDRAASLVTARGFSGLKAPDEIENKSLARLLAEHARQITSWS